MYNLLIVKVPHHIHHHFDMLARSLLRERPLIVHFVHQLATRALGVERGGRGGVRDAGKEKGGTRRAATYKSQ